MNRSLAAALVLAALPLAACSAASGDVAAPHRAPSSSPAAASSGGPSLRVPAGDQAARVAARFVDFAAGRLDGPPVDTPVVLYLDGRPVRTIDAARSAHPDAYALRGVAHSAVTAIRDADGVRLGSLADRCLSRPSTPRGTGGSQVRVIRPVHAACADDFAVRVWSNDVGQLVAVDLVRAR